MVILQVTWIRALKITKRLLDSRKMPSFYTRGGSVHPFHLSVSQSAVRETVAAAVQSGTSIKDAFRYAVVANAISRTKDEAFPGNVIKAFNLIFTYYLVLIIKLKLILV